MSDTPDILIRRPKKIKYGYLGEYDGTLYEFKDIVSKPLYLHFPGERQGKPDLLLSNPKIIIRTNSYSTRLMSMYFNKSHPNKSTDICFSYNKNKYSELCFGDWYSTINNALNSKKLPEILHNYLSEYYDDNGHIRINQITGMACVACGQSLARKEEPICDFCQISINKNGDLQGFYKEDCLDSSSDKFHWSNKHECIIYTGRIRK